MLGYLPYDKYQSQLYVTGYYVRLSYLMIGIMYRKSTVCDRVLC